MSRKPLEICQIVRFNTRIGACVHAKKSLSYCALIVFTSPRLRLKVAGVGNRHRIPRRTNREQS